MNETKAQTTPMIIYLCLTQDNSYVFQDFSLYKSIIGALQYVLITRPEPTLLLTYFLNTCINLRNALKGFKMVPTITCWNFSFWSSLTIYLFINHFFANAN